MGIRTVELYTQDSLTVTFTAAGLSFMASCSNMVEKHQLMILQGTMAILLARPFQVYKADLPARLILNTKTVIVVYSYKASNYIVHHLGEKPSPKK